MAMFGQYTGQRVQPLPSGFLSAAMQQAKMTSDAYGDIGDTIGDAFKAYGKRKAENEEWDVLIQGAAQKALELRTFLEGDKPVSGKGIGPQGQDVTLDPNTGNVKGGRPGQPDVTEGGSAGKAMADMYGLKKPSPFSQKTELLYEIAGDKKLVDKFLAGETTLAQKKGLLANLNMYNSKLDDYSKRAAIEEHRHKVGQRDAWTKSYGAGLNQPDIELSPARTVEDTTTKQIASKSRLDALLHMQETGQQLSPEEFNELEGYFASGGEFRPGPERQSGPLPLAPLGKGPQPVAPPKVEPKLPDFSAYSGSIEQERKKQSALQTSRSILQQEMDKVSAKKADVDTKLQVGKIITARNTPSGTPYLVDRLKKGNRRWTSFQKKMLHNAGWNPDTGERLRAARGSAEKVDPKLVKQSSFLEKQIQAYSNSLKSIDDDIKGREQYLSYADAEGRKLGERALGAFRSEVPKIAQQGIGGYLAGQLTPKDVVVDDVRGGGVVRPGIPPMPERGYVDKPWTETETTTREIPAETIPAEPVDRKAAHMKAFIEQGGQMTPESLATFDKLYPEAGIISQPVPGVPGATALFDTKGKFLQVVAPPTLTATERAAVNAVTFTPNTGYTGIAPSKEEAIKMRDLIATSNEVNEMMDDLMAMADEGKVKWVGPNKIRAKAMIATLVGKMRIPLTGGGPLTLEERKYIQENLFTDPYDWKTWESTSKAQIETVKGMMTNSVDKKAKVLGLTPVGEQPGQAGGAPTRRAYTGTKFEDR